MSLKSLWNSLFPRGGNGASPTPKPSRFRAGACSVTGNYRENNEDRCLVDPQGRFFLVADGMGGQSAGEKASEMAVELISKRFEQQLGNSPPPAEKTLEVITEAVIHANSEILALGAIDTKYHSMGTTVALLVVSDANLFVAGVGDSRVYRLQGGALEQLTTDDSLSEALRIAGTISKEEAATHRYKHVLVKYLGSKEASDGPKSIKIPLQKDDRFVLCSDGVTEGVPDDVLGQLLGQFDDPQKTAEMIVNTALERGSKDNITCVVVFVD
ncbi:MAG: protein phosphatase 2C domain-containing protein [Planctomycetales bacterium]